MLLVAAMMAAAKRHLPRTDVRTWCMPSLSAIADTTRFADTTMLNYHDIDIQQRYSLSSTTNGNVLVSPIESRIINDRVRTIDDPFAWSLAPYVVTPQQQRYFNTKTPYSAVAYKKGFVSGHPENDLSVLFTGNLNRRTNLGLEMEYLSSLGHYQHTEGKLFRGTVWGSYDGTHYSMHGAFSWSKLSSFDNGGLKDINDMTSSLGSNDLPVRMQAMTDYRYLSGYLHNQYTLTKDREYHDTIEVVESGQTLQKDTVKVKHTPMMTFSHIIDINNSNRRYVEHDADQGFYKQIYFDSIATRDSTDVLTIRNTVAVSFCEAFNTKLKFGATVFAMNECQRFFMDTLPYDSINTYKWYNNTYVGGAIHKHSGSWIRYHVEGKVCLLGYKIGEFDVTGRLETTIPTGKDKLRIAARAYVKSETPSPYLRHYRSNHLCWDNSFGYTFRVLGGATVEYPTRWIKPRLDFSFENIARPIFFTADDWLPRQYGGSVQVITADLGLDLTTPWINLENRVVFQHTTNDSVMPVPMLILQHRLYYHGRWFRALDAQIGTDLRYFTLYHAPVLCPATGMFANQQDATVGNYPWMNVFASFYVRSIRLRFFFQYQHISYLFMGRTTRYQTMPGYPTNRDIFRAGVAWHFYN